MRLCGTACTVLVSTLAGCSLIYDPSGLSKPMADAPPMIDAAPPPDMPTDVNLDNLLLDAVAPTTILEGQGTGGSRPAVLVITGGNIGPDATVQLVPVEPPGPMLEIDNAHAVRSPSGSAIAVTITAPIDPDRGSDGAVDAMFTVQVTQSGGMGVVTKPVPDAIVKLTNLPELTAAVASSAQLKPLYSMVAVPAGITFATGGPRAVIRAVSSIELGDLHADAAVQAAGPGGSRGGDAGSNGAGPSGGEHGALLNGVNIVGGGGGGYGEAGGNGSGIGAPPVGGARSGDAFITSYMTNSSSGGGSGIGNPGGGGGGTVEVTAGGTLVVGNITVAGAGAPNNGGGGSGGAIIVRGRAAATIGALSAPGGSTTDNNGGDGAIGRVRYDLSTTASAPPVTSAVASQGAMFAPATATINPVITANAHQKFQLVSAGAGTKFDVFVLNAAGVTTESSSVTFGSATAILTPGTALTAGYNQVCVVTPTGNVTLAESTNCIAVAYVP